jgi:hypothetical protein
MFSLIADSISEILSLYAFFFASLSLQQDMHAQTPALFIALLDSGG